MARRASDALSCPPAFWVGAALLGLVLVNALVTPGFLEVRVVNGRLFCTPVDIVHQAAPMLLLALGMTLVIGTGGIDLSVGAVMAIAGALAAVLLTGTGLAVPWILVGVLGAGAVIGLVNGGLVSILGIQPIIATLILLTAGRGLAQLITGGHPVPFERPAFQALAGGALLGLPVTCFIVAGALAAAVGVTRHTAAGLYIQAVGDNEKAARLAGLPVGRIKFGVYGCLGLLSALAGMIEAADIKCADPSNCGLYLELDAILAVVLGGTLLTGGRISLVGSVLGALLIQTLTTTLLMSDIDVAYNLVVKAVAVLAVCGIQAPAIRGAVRARMQRGRATT